MFLFSSIFDRWISLIFALIRLMVDYSTASSLWLSTRSEPTYLPTTLPEGCSGSLKSSSFSFSLAYTGLKRAFIGALFVIWLTLMPYAVMFVCRITTIVVCLHSYNNSERIDVRIVN